MTETTLALDRTDEQLVVTSGARRFSISRDTGVLCAVEHTNGGDAYRLTPTEEPPIQWTVGGSERRNPPAATTAYEGAEEHGGALSLVDYEFTRTGPTAQVRTISECGDWRLTNRYTVAADERGIEWEFDLVYRGSRDEVRLRSVRIPLWIPATQLTGATVDVPGGPVPPSLDLGDTAAGSILDWGLRRYHAGLVGISESQDGIALWAFSQSVPPSVAIDYEPGGRGLGIEYRFETAARLSPDEGISLSRLGIDCFDCDWDAWLDSFDQWWSDVGVHTPDTCPQWFESATIFEAHVGAAQFPDDFEYAPYPTVSALVEDLPRIASMGFDTLQLMPRHPYPSYTVPSDDEAQSVWGDPAELRRLVDAAHAHDVRVIFDFVLHGVLDEAVLDRTLDAIHARKSDPWQDPLAAYVLSHAEEWRPHLPERHPLVESNPEWFVRTDDGEIAHRYTHALDLANREVQEWFIDRLTGIVESLGIDGFRFDAPTWNAFPNWDTDLPYPAGYAIFGAKDFFDRARARLRSRDEELAVYVEAASPLFRTASDANYSYDELWLFEAVFDAETTRMGREPFGAVTGDDLAAWFRRRAAALPDGARTAHQLDSHDTFWWPDPGNKWFRERYGPDRTNAVLSLVVFLPGPFMNYVGGEQKLNGWLERLLTVRSRYEELSAGACTYQPDVFDSDGFDSDGFDRDAVFTAVRTLGDRRTLVAVNLSQNHQTGTVEVGELVDDGNAVVFDPLHNEVLAHEVSVGTGLPVEFEPLQPRVLVCRRIG